MAAIESLVSSEESIVHESWPLLIIVDILNRRIQVDSTTLTLKAGKEDTVQLLVGCELSNDTRAHCV